MPVLTSLIAWMYTRCVVPGDSWCCLKGQNGYRGRKCWMNASLQHRKKKHNLMFVTSQPSQCVSTVCDAVTETVSWSLITAKPSNRPPNTVSAATVTSRVIHRHTRGEVCTDTTQFLSSVDGVHLSLFLGRECKSHLSSRGAKCRPWITNAGVCGAPAPAAVLREWLWLPYLHLHRSILGYSFSDGRYQTQWRQRLEPRVWRLYSSLVSCHQATGQRILRERKKESISVCLTDLFTGNTNDPLYSCLNLTLWGLFTCLEPFYCCRWTNWNSPIFSSKLGLWAKANFVFDSTSVSLQEVKLNGGYKHMLTK